MKRLFILTGLLLLTGALFNRTIAQNRENQVREQSIKYQRLMAYIDAFYVDTVNLQKLTEDAIIKALSDLDPHSVYITKEEVDEMNEPLEGGFFQSLFIGISQIDQVTIMRQNLIGRITEFLTTLLKAFHIFSRIGCCHPLALILRK